MLNSHFCEDNEEVIPMSNSRFHGNNIANKTLNDVAFLTPPSMLRIHTPPVIPAKAGIQFEIKDFNHNNDKNKKT